MKVLVTGGAGFIGSHVVDLLLQAGHSVAVVDNLHTGKRRNLNPQAVFHRVDLRDLGSLDAVFEQERVQAILHQAALANVRESMQDPVTYTEVNVIGTLNLLELAREHGVQKFVFASTGGAVYGEGHTDQGSRLPFTEESWPQPRDNYGANKLSCEYHLDLYQANYGIPCVSLRYPNVYGPRQDDKGEAGVVAIFAGAMLRNEPTKITGDGTQVRDFTYVEDIARANLLALEKDVTGIFNVGTGVPTDINTIHRILAELTGYTLEPAYVPRPVGEVHATYLDSTKAQRELGWEPQVSLREGLRRTVEWMRAHLDEL